MDCLSCGGSMTFISTDNRNGLLGYWQCTCSGRLTLPRGLPTTIKLRHTRPDYRCNFENGETLDIGDDGGILYNDKPVESWDDAKKVMALLMKGLVAVAGGR